MNIRGGDVNLNSLNILPYQFVQKIKSIKPKINEE